jgi:putative UDP-glcNAc-4,6-dehydratase
MKKTLSKIINKIYDGDNNIDISEMKYLPRWGVLFIDVCILLFSLLIIEQIGVYFTGTMDFYKKCSLIVGVNVFFMIIFRTYSGIVRHSTFIDLSKIFLSIVYTIFVLVILNVVVYWRMDYKLFKTSLLLVYAGVSFVLLFIYRLFVKEFFNFIREYRKNFQKKRILVLGIDEVSVSLAKIIADNSSVPYHLVGFITERTDSKQASLLNRKIYTKNDIEEYQKTLDIDGVLINRNGLTKEAMQEWVNFFLEKGIQMYKAPVLEEIREGGDYFKIQNIQIEDLLNRKPISIENEEVKSRHYNKNVLITGGAGSIGSEIVRQVAMSDPALVVVLDQAETPLYAIELELKESFPNVNFKFVLADISNINRLESVFEEYKFSVVYHAAAYKHVPLVEENPHEGVLVNIQGSKNLALLASKYKVDTFVMVSTDKAVNPTNVMGASKRAAELFVQALQNQSGNTTKFVTTRFGNVLGSNGSVIPYFKKQIEKGGPITITHPDIVRYFMTIPEACELVLQAGTMGVGGEIFVFDMGEPVKIVDLAERMIRLSGFEPDIDIKIVYTGLRPGEKLYEELLSDGTKTLPTHHEKIMISKDETMEFEKINTLTQKIYDLAKESNKIEVVRTLKEIVKEFKSNNSVYQQLD